MKIINFEYNGVKLYGVVVGDKILTSTQLKEVLGLKFPESIMDFFSQETLINNVRNFIDKKLLSKRMLDEAISYLRVKVLPPVPLPPKIVCLGLNYKDHAEEQGVKPPTEPVIFFKPRTSITGPFDEIFYPSIVTKLDYEGELAIVIGRSGKDIAISNSMDHVLGYTVFNDVSARGIQFKDGQWSRGKSFDTFAPIGPWIITKEQIRPHNLTIVTRVNGEIRQNSSTSNMIIKIPEVIVSLSKVMTLEPGDLIATGTPSGVGIFMKPEPRLLKPDDVVDITIEGIGAIRNRVVIV